MNTSRPAGIHPPRDETLPIYDVKLDARLVAALESSAYSNDTLPITFLASGETYEQAKIRHRGAWARGWPKKPLKIFFSKEHSFDGQHCINLNSGWRDPAFVREAVAYEVFRRCGVPAPEVRIVRLDLNGEFWGMYLQVEQPDDAFLKKRNLAGAAVYKANSQRNQADERDLGELSSYPLHYEKQTRKKLDYEDLQSFCRDLNSTTDTYSFFSKQVDLDRYVSYLAANALVQNWDAFNKNHYLIHDLKGSGRWFAVPWDLDRTLGDHWSESFDRFDLPLLLGTRQRSGVTGWNRLQDRFFSDPSLTALFLKRMEELLTNEFTKEKLFPVVDALEAQITGLEEAERKRWPRMRGDFHSGIEELKRYIEKRRAFLLHELSASRRS